MTKNGRALELIDYICLFGDVNSFCDDLYFKSVDVSI